MNYEIVFEDDMVYMETRVQYAGDGKWVVRKDPIMSKEVFVECYNKWILGEEKQEGE